MSKLNHIQSHLNQIADDHLHRQMSFNLVDLDAMDLLDLHLCGPEYDLAISKPEQLADLVGWLAELCEAVQDEIVSPDLPKILNKPEPDRLGLAAKICFKRALYLILQNRFCEASLATIHSSDILKEGSPGDGKVNHIRKVLAVFNALLDETFMGYARQQAYVPSDCRSNCGYCQDPLSTVAKYCGEALQNLGGSEEQLQELWTRAASMLAAYCEEKGANLEQMRFGAPVPRQASNALRLILMGKRVRLEEVLARVAFHRTRLLYSSLENCPLMAGLSLEQPV